jgi:hypothetical protein
MWPFISEPAHRLINVLLLLCVLPLPLCSAALSRSFWTLISSLRRSITLHYINNWRRSAPYTARTAEFPVCTTRNSNFLMSLSTSCCSLQRKEIFVSPPIAGAVSIELWRAAVADTVGYSRPRVQEIDRNWSLFQLDVEQGHARVNERIILWVPINYLFNGCFASWFHCHDKDMSFRMWLSAHTIQDGKTWSKRDGDHSFHGSKLVS